MDVGRARKRLPSLSVEWTCVRTRAASLALVYQSLENMQDVRSPQKLKLSTTSPLHDSKLRILKSQDAALKSPHVHVC